MALDMAKMKAKLQELESGGKTKSDNVWWRPQEGDQADNGGESHGENRPGAQRNGFRGAGHGPSAHAESCASA